MEDFVVLAGGEAFVDLDRLVKSALLASFFARRYGRSVKRLVEREQLAVLFVPKQALARGELTTKASYSAKHDARLVRREARIGAIIHEAQTLAYAPAPPVLQREGFVDKDGKRHELELRGERAMDGVIFRASDVARVLGVESIERLVRQQESSFQEAVDFVWRTLASEDVQDRHDGDGSHLARVSPLRVELFLTFAGVLHTLRSAQSPVSEDLRKWLYAQMTTIVSDASEQKQAMIGELCRVDKRFLEAFLKLVPTAIACLYLIDTTASEDGKKVYKFGRSENVKERFYKHSAAFGDGCVLDTIVFIPEEKLSEAETRLKHSLPQSLRFEDGVARELLLLDVDDYKAVRTMMRTIADKYNGSMAVHALLLETETKNLELKLTQQAHEYEMRIKDLECSMELLEQRSKGNEAAAESKVAALEREVELLSESYQLRAQVKDVEHSAQLAEMERRLEEKERRIAELEAAVARRSKPGRAA